MDEQSGRGPQEELGGVVQRNLRARPQGVANGPEASNRALPVPVRGQVMSYFLKGLLFQKEKTEI